DKGIEPIASVVSAKAQFHGLKAKAEQLGRGQGVPVLQAQAVLMGPEVGKVVVGGIVPIGGKGLLLGVKIVRGPLGVVAVARIEAKSFPQPHGYLQGGGMGANAPSVPVVPIL